MISNKLKDNFEKIIKFLTSLMLLINFLKDYKLIKKSLIFMVRESINIILKN